MHHLWQKFPEPVCTAPHSPFYEPESWSLVTAAHKAVWPETNLCWSQNLDVGPLPLSTTQLVLLTRHNCSGLLRRQGPSHFSSVVPTRPQYQRARVNERNPSPRTRNAKQRDQCNSIRRKPRAVTEAGDPRVPGAHPRVPRCLLLKSPKPFAKAELRFHNSGLGPT